MNHQIDLASVAAPQADFDVFPFMNKLRQDAAGKPPSALLQRFHAALQARFPDSPWMKEYAGDHGRLTLVQRAHDVVPHILHIAGELGLTVVDKQSAQVHRPPTYQVTLEGPSEGVGMADAAARVAGLMKQPVEAMEAILAAGHRPVIRKGVSRARATQYIDALRDRGGCHATFSLEAGAVERPEPPAPPPPPARLPMMEMPAATRAEAPIPEQARAAIEAVEAELANQTDSRLYDVAEGVRLLCCGIGLNFLLRGALQQVPPLVSLVCATVLSGLGVFGCLRVAKGLAYPALVRAVVVGLPVIGIVASFAAGFDSQRWFMVSAAVMVVHLLLYLWLAGAGIRAMKKEGLELGLFGARKELVRELGGLEEGVTLGSTKAAWAVFGFVLLAYIASPKDMNGAAAPLFIGDSKRPCEYVGTWHLRHQGYLVMSVVMTEKGAFEATVRNGQSEQVSGGDWYAEGGKLTWLHKSGPQKGKEIVDVAFNDGDMVVTPSNGESMRLVLDSRGTLQRCAAAKR